MLASNLQQRPTGVVPGFDSTVFLLSIQKVSIYSSHSYG